MRIAELVVGDDARVAALGDLLDGPADAVATRRFLSEPGHHLLVAYEGTEPAGFVSGVEVTHPDKGTEMFLYELAVAPRYRRQGFGTALVQHLGAVARDRDCYGMWVLTDETNAAALATYARAGGVAERGQVVVVFTF